jgi:hypothetical protein
VAVVVDGAPEPQEGWCVVTACDPFLREFAGWKAVLGFDLGRSEKALLHRVLVASSKTAAKGQPPAVQHNSLVIGPSNPAAKNGKAI